MHRFAPGPQSNKLRDAKFPMRKVLPEIKACRVSSKLELKLGFFWCEVDQDFGDITIFGSHLSPHER